VKMPKSYSSSLRTVQINLNPLWHHDQVESIKQSSSPSPMTLDGQSWRASMAGDWNWMTTSCERLYGNEEGGNRT
jgi:hypothetical protein